MKQRRGEYQRVATSEDANVEGGGPVQRFEIWLIMNTILLLLIFLALVVVALLVLPIARSATGNLEETLTKGKEVLSEAKAIVQKVEQLVPDAATLQAVTKDLPNDLRTIREEVQHALQWLKKT